MHHGVWKPLFSTFPQIMYPLFPVRAPRLLNLARDLPLVSGCEKCRVSMRVRGVGRRVEGLDGRALAFGDSDFFDQLQRANVHARVRACVREFGAATGERAVERGVKIGVRRRWLGGRGGG